MAKVRQLSFFVFRQHLPRLRFVAQRANALDLLPWEGHVDELPLLDTRLELGS
jgi:hypothetical protein